MNVLNIADDSLTGRVGATDVVRTAEDGQTVYRRGIIRATSWDGREWTAWALHGGVWSALASAFITPAAALVAANRSL